MSILSYMLQYVNNPSLADISFIVDGKPFYAHRIALVASSDAFRVMFDGGYKERVSPPFCKYACLPLSCWPIHLSSFWNSTMQICIHPTLLLQH